MLNSELWQAPLAGGGDFYTHQIANSCRFSGSANDDGTHFMYHARGTPTNADKCTISAWVKRGKLGSKNLMFTGGGGDGPYSWYGFNTANEFWHLQSGDQPRFESNAFFRDTSAWYHIVIAQDSTQGTAANRNKIYINGVQYTDWGDFEDYSTQNADFAINTSGVRLFVGSGGASATNSFYPFDGLIAEYVFIDGLQYAASDFGETKNGVWIPKDPSGLTFGNNGAYLKFESSSALGNDSSGNNNDFTVTGVAAHDQMLDSPTFNSDSNGGNFATLGPLWKNPSAVTLSEGNLVLTATANTLGAMSNWAVPASGKWYWEVCYTNQYSTGTNFLVGIAYAKTSLTAVETADQIVYYSENGMKIVESTRTAGYGDGFDSPDGDAVVGVAVDRVNNTLNFSYNGTFQGTIDISGLTSNEFFPYTGFSGVNGTQGCTFNFGQDGTFAGAISAGGNADDTGYGNFAYDPPTGFLAMCTGNLPIADEVDPAQTDDNFPQKLFSPALYTGTGADINVPVGFQPDWTWVKKRNGGYNHAVYDSSRGVTKYLTPDDDRAEVTSANTLKAFISNGFTFGADATGNENNASMVSWNWRANGGTTSTNSTGSLSVTQQVDPSGSFSISTYSGDGGTDTIGHGLSRAPTMVIVKQRNGVNNWAVYAKGAGATKYAYLDGTAAFGTATMWQNTAPSSSLVYLGDNNEVNAGSRTYVAYCFADTEGFIKSGSYVGNGDGSDGAFAYTGFKPAFLLVKKTTSNNWRLQDNARDPFNPVYRTLLPNSAAAEDAYTDGTDYNDFLSNGFKLAVGGDTANWNADGVKYVYLAFAAMPFKYATAR
jgi:hypothetical protein